jgi:eukaryotic-like serine/threonine-protein kinase
MSMIGKTLGNFEITTPLGLGGMGEVYQAKDRKLGRDVAIKVLPEEFAKDSGRVARFQREAKLLASLNHPNIAAIYGLEESGGTSFLVLELVEGQTLADRLQRGPIPIEESLKLALQIAQALEAAHEKGVIHRDLKPANIKVTPEGKVKVLDFGLAKAFAGEQAEMNLSNSPTLSNAATQQGVILGTAAYMSPEQARGTSVDKRSDIWAFGCVLLEMLTGRRTWTGATLTDIMVAVLAKDPDFSFLSPNLPPRIRELLSRCLQKDPTERFRDVGDVRIEIKHAIGESQIIAGQPVKIAERQMRMATILPWIAAIAILSVIIGGLAVWMMKPTPPLESRLVARFDYELPKDHEIGGLNLTQPMLAVSPDGSQFVYCTPGGIYLRSMNEMAEAKLIPGTEGNPRQPFFSPNGQWVGYWSSADHKLKKIPISGGNAVPLGGESAAGFISWNVDDTIIYSTKKGFIRISANTGKWQMLIKSQDEVIFTPRLLPGGKAVIFTVSIAGEYKVAVQSIESGKRNILTPGSDAYYSPTGHLVYILGKDLVAIPFDLETLDVTGVPVPMVKGILRATGAPQFAVSASGTLVYLPETAKDASSRRTLHWVDRNGGVESLGAEPNAYSNPKISTDGEKVAFSIGSLSAINIIIWDIVHGYPTRRTSEENINTLPLWTPDGTRITFYRQTHANFEIHSMAAAGAEKVTPLYSQQSGAILPECWLKDGKTLLTTAAPVGSENFQIGMLSTEGDSKWRPLIQEQEKHSELQPQLSHNGRLMAYTSNESGQYEVYVRSFPVVDNVPFRISISGGDSPLWSPDGRELFYRNGDEVMTVPITKTDPDFTYGTPKSLFQGNYIPSDFSIGSNEIHSWDIHPNGKRFLMMKDAGTNASAGRGPRRINIILNWFEELKQQMPVK